MNALRPVPGFPGYLVSRSGELYSQLAPNGKGINPNKFRRITARIDPVKGYPVVALQISRGKQTHRFLHRIVVETWIGPPPFDGAQVRHLDNSRTNCHVDNLAWGTKAENEADKERFGTRPRGETHKRAKLTEADVRRIRELRSQGMKLDELAAMFGVGFSTISRIALRTIWKAVA